MINHTIDYYSEYKRGEFFYLSGYSFYHGYAINVYKWPDIKLCTSHMHSSLHFQVHLKKITSNIKKYKLREVNFTTWRQINSPQAKGPQIKKNAHKNQRKIIKT